MLSAISGSQPFDHLRFRRVIVTVVVEVCEGLVPLLTRRGGCGAIIISFRGEYK